MLPGFAALTEGAGVAYATPGEPGDAGGGGGTGGTSGGGQGAGPIGPTPPGGGGPVGGDKKYGVNNRPDLKNPAPFVEGMQRWGDNAIGKNPALNKNPFIGGTYHTLFGGAGNKDDGDDVLEGGEAYQGAYRGVLNGGFRASERRSNRCTLTPTAPGCGSGEPGSGGGTGGGEGPGTE